MLGVLSGDPHSAPLVETLAGVSLVRVVCSLEGNRKCHLWAGFLCSTSQGRRLEEGSVDGRFFRTWTGIMDKVHLKGLELCAKN